MTNEVARVLQEELRVTREHSGWQMGYLKMLTEHNELLKRQSELMRKAREVEAVLDGYAADERRVEEAVEEAREDIEKL